MHLLTEEIDYGRSLDSNISARHGFPFPIIKIIILVREKYCLDSKKNINWLQRRQLPIFRKKQKHLQSSLDS